MKDRLKKIERVVHVQQQLKRLAEWKLALLRQDEAKLKQAQEELVNSLSDQAIHHGLFVDSMARRLTRLSGEAEEVRVASDNIQQKIREETLRLKRTERLAHDMALEVEAHDEKENLERTVEAVGAKKNDSSA